MSKPGKSLRNLCKRLKVRLTVKRGKKRVYKSVKVLKGQCKRKAGKKKRRRRKFGGKWNPKLSKPKLRRPTVVQSMSPADLEDFTSAVTMGTLKLPTHPKTTSAANILAGLREDPRALIKKRKRFINKSRLRRKELTKDDFSYLLDPLITPPPLQRAVNWYPSDPVEYNDLFPSTGNDQPQTQTLLGSTAPTHLDLPTGVDHSDWPTVGPVVPTHNYDSMVPLDPNSTLAPPKLKRSSNWVPVDGDDGDDRFLVKPPLMRQKRWFGKKKKVSRKKGPSAALKKLCKKLGVRLTIKRGKKRVYKSEKVLKKQCKNKMKKRK